MPRIIWTKTLTQLCDCCGEPAYEYQDAVYNGEVVGYVMWFEEDGPYYGGGLIQRVGPSTTLEAAKQQVEAQVTLQ